MGRVLFPRAYRALLAMSQAVVDSDLDCSIARLIRPTDDPVTGTVQAAFLGRDKVAGAITRGTSPPSCSTSSAVALAAIAGQTETTRLRHHGPARREDPRRPSRTRYQPLLRADRLGRAAARARQAVDHAPGDRDRSRRARTDGSRRLSRRPQGAPRPRPTLSLVRESNARDVKAMIVHADTSTTMSLESRDDVCPACDRPGEGS
jgi:hypothetical protein